MESVSPVIQLLDLVWRYATIVTGKSRQKVCSSMHAALELAIESGMPFALNDFEVLMSKYSFGRYAGVPWNVSSEPYYSLACNTRNVQAARSFEVWVGRRPFVSKSIYKTGIRGCYRNTGRLSMGDVFILSGSTLKVTSFARDGSHLMAVDYRPGSAPGEDKYPRRVKVTREMLKQSSTAA